MVKGGDIAHGAGGSSENFSSITKFVGHSDNQSREKQCAWKEEVKTEKYNKARLRMPSKAASIAFHYAARSVFTLTNGSKKHHNLCVPEPYYRPKYTLVCGSPLNTTPD
jgi:hypothetical protein